MKNSLVQPYPFYENPKSVLWRLLLLSGLIAFILIVFQPFGTSQFQHPNKTLFLLGYGIVTFVGFGIPFLLLPLVFPNQFREEKWVVWKQIMLFLLGLTLTAIGSFLHLIYFFNSTFEYQNFMNFLGVFLAIGFFPTIILTLLDYNIKLKNHSSHAKNLTQKLNPVSTSTTIISISDESGKNNFQVSSKDLLYIQASSNYVEIFYLIESKLTKKLLRNSLTNVETQLNFHYLNRCHRSYIANLNQVEKITGNAQGYKLHFRFSDEIQIPVSRSKGKNLMRTFQK